MPRARSDFFRLVIGLNALWYKRLDLGIFIHPSEVFPAEGHPRSHGNVQIVLLLLWKREKSYVITAIMLPICLSIRCESPAWYVYTRIDKKGNRLGVREAAGGTTLLCGIDSHCPRRGVRANFTPGSIQQPRLLSYVRFSTTSSLSAGPSFLLMLVFFFFLFRCGKERIILSRIPH